MFAYLKGILISSTPTQVTVEVQGIGYLIFIPCSLLGQLPPLGESVLLYTSLVIRENSHSLYGFLSAQERDLFEVLMNVSGIGPKLAISLIGHLPLHSLKAAVEHQDLVTLCRVPGIGKKTAERLVIELRDKLKLLPSSSPAALAVSYSVDDSQLQHINDATLALMNLGYKQSAAQKAIKESLKELPEGADLAILITTALRNIS